MTVTPEQARAELARRELARRAAAREQTVEPPAVQPTFRGRGPAGLPSFGQGLTAVADLAATAGRSALGSFAGGVRAAPHLVLGGLDTIGNEAEKAFTETSEAPIFNRPLATPEGQQLASRIAPALGAVETGIKDVFGSLPGGPPVQAAAETGVIGALELLGLKGLGKGATAVARSATPEPGTFIPEIKDLFAAGRVAFNEARINGSAIKPQALNRAASNVRNIKNEVGLKIDFDEVNHAQAFRVRERLLNDLESGNVDFDRLLALRESAGEIAGNPDRAIAMRGVRLKNEIDDFVDSLRPGDVIGGDPERAAQALKSAREFWRDASAARTIEREMNIAGINANTFSGAGYENALRTQFKQLARRIERGREKGFKPAEIAAIKKVAAGGPVENLLRFIGKAAPTGIVSGGIGAGLGFALGGPGGAVALPAIGALGRGLATRSTISNAQRALELPLSRSLLTP